MSRLSQPYLRELADLRDGSRYATAFSELLSKVGWRPKDVKQVVMAPRTLASADKSIKRIEAGDLRLRVRSVELETQLQNVETRQRLFGAAAVAVLLAQTSLGGVAATYEGAARVWRLVLSRGCGVGAAWASLEAFGAYCLLRKADQNKGTRTSRFTVICVRRLLMKKPSSAPGQGPSLRAVEEDAEDDARAGTALPQLMPEDDAADGQTHLCRYHDRKATVTFLMV